VLFSCCGCASAQVSSTSTSSIKCSTRCHATSSTREPDHPTLPVLTGQTRDNSTRTYTNKQPRHRHMGCCNWCQAWALLTEHQCFLTTAHVPRKRAAERLAGSYIGLNVICSLLAHSWPGQAQLTHQHRLYCSLTASHWHLWPVLLPLTTAAATALTVPKPQTST
jgi:hypothetical protein